jgi:ribosomal protein L37E
MKGMIRMSKKISACKNCGKETFNTSKEWSGFCSVECEKDYNKRKTNEG